MQDQIEIWKPVKDYEGYYEISNFGKVKSLQRMVNGKGGKQRVNKERILRPCFAEGYPFVKLNVNKKGFTAKIHRLVAIAFVPNPNNYPIVHHKNEIKSDHSIDNLEWCNNRINVSYSTNKENTYSKQIGVTYAKKINRWISGTNIKDKTVYFGCFKTEQEAIDCYFESMSKLNITVLETQTKKG